jgi:ArsR family transcriptional regulator
MMSDQERSLAERRSRVLKALAHPSRMYIVARLARGEATVGRLVESVGSDVSTVSKHLSIMKSAGILVDRKEGNRVLYALKCPCIMDFIRCVDDVILEDARGGFACLLPSAAATLPATEES